MYSCQPTSQSNTHFPVQETPDAPHSGHFIFHSCIHLPAARLTGSLAKSPFSVGIVPFARLSLAECGSQQRVGGPCFRLRRGAALLRPIQQNVRNRSSTPAAALRLKNRRRHF